MIPLIAKTPGPFYMRLARPSSNLVYDEHVNSFEIGKASVLRDGYDATIIACGLMVTEALKMEEYFKEITVYVVE